MKTEQMNLFDYSVKYEIVKSIGDVDNEDDNYITNIYGKIFYPTNPNTPQIGEIKATLFRYGNLVDEGIPNEAFDVLDSIDQDLSDLGQVLFKTHKDWFEEQDCYSSNILILDKIKINKECRGKDIGLAALWQTIQTFFPCSGLVFIQPKPDFEVVCTVGKSKKLDNEIKDMEQKAKKKLESHYERLGFKQVRDSKFWYMNLNYNQPSFKDVFSK